MPERNKCSTYEKMIGAFLALCFFFISLEIFLKGKVYMDISISTR